MPDLQNFSTPDERAKLEFVSHINSRLQLKTSDLTSKRIMIMEEMVTLMQKFGWHGYITIIHSRATVNTKNVAIFETNTNREANNRSTPIPLAYLQYLTDHSCDAKFDAIY